MKLISGLTKLLNSCTTLLFCIQLDKDSPVIVKNHNISNYFMYYKVKKYLLGNKKQDIKKDPKSWQAKFQIIKV